MPEMAVYNLHTLQKVDLLGLSQMQPGLLDRLNTNTAGMILRSHQHLAEKQSTWKETPHLCQLLDNIRSSISNEYSPIHAIQYTRIFVVTFCFNLENSSFTCKSTAKIC